MRRIAALAVLLTLAIGGCSSVPAPAQPASMQPDQPALAASTAAPGGELEDDAELAAFEGALVGQSPLDPDAIVGAIEAAGFDRSTIERTREIDSLGAPVTFLEIAVSLEQGCLVGQVGDGEPMAMRTDALGGQRCLVGDVIALD